MRSLLFLLLSTGLLCLPACKHQRTVVAGPASMDLGINDYDPNESAKNEKIMQQAAQTGVSSDGIGQGQGFGSRFGSFNPYGYGKNAMQDKMFNKPGKTGKPTKMFSQTKSFLSRKFEGTKELEKSSYAGLKSSQWEDKLYATDETSYGDVPFRGSEKRIGQTLNNDAGKMAAVKDYAAGSKRANTGSYYLAEKAMAPSRVDAHARNANSGDAGQVQGLINSGNASAPATEADIRSLLGK